MPETNSITIENVILIWLDANRTVHDTITSTARFQQFVNLILPFHDPDQCLDFLSDIKNEKIFLIVSDTFGQQIVSFLADLDQIDSIYVFCKERGRNEKWASKEKKVRGVFTKIEPIYDAIRRDIRQCEDDLLSFRSLSLTYDHPEMSNHSDQFFLVTQLIKEILLDMDYSPNSKEAFVQFCASQYEDNPYQCKLIEEFRMNYQASTAIRWYTRECFIAFILNKASRIRDLDILLMMGFFIRDLHQEIQRLHSKLNKQIRPMVYRGQGITAESLHHLLEHSNGFLSFNHFFIATTDKQIPLAYASSARDHHGLIGVVFHMEIDPTKTIFTPLDKIGYFPESDKELLFSMHTIFRISGIQQMGDDLWQIQLRSTGNDGKDLTRFVRKDIEGKSQPERLDILRTQLRIIDEPKNKAEDTSENPLQIDSDP